MTYKWFKFYGGEYLADPKIGRLTPAERSCWVTLLSMASMTMTGTIEFLTIEDLLEKSGVRWNPYEEGDWEKCQNILQKLASMKMIKVNNEKSEIIIINWEKRQEHNLTGAERVAKHRRNDNGDDNDNDNGTSLSFDNEKRPMTGYERLKKHRENKTETENDNENVTTNVTNVTLEENRIEEKRERVSLQEINFNIGFPLPENWSDNSFLDSDGNQILEIRDENNRRVKQSEITQKRKQFEITKKSQKTKIENQDPEVQELISAFKTERGITKFDRPVDYKVVRSVAKKIIEETGEKEVVDNLVGIIRRIKNRSPFHWGNLVDFGYLDRNFTKIIEQIK